MSEAWTSERILAALDAEVADIMRPTPTRMVCRAAAASMRSMLAMIQETLSVHDSNRDEYFLHEALVRDMRAALRGSPVAESEKGKEPDGTG